MTEDRDRTPPAGGIPPSDDFHKLVLDAIPALIFVVDDDVRIFDCNKAAAAMIGTSLSGVFRRRGGDVLHCIHAIRAPGGCGTGPACADCTLRRSVSQAFAGHEPRRVRHKVEILRGEKTIEMDMLVTTAPVQYRGAQLALLVLEDITELVALRRIVPMCAYCRKIRDDEEYWRSVESYIGRQFDISHGICPDCLKREWPQASPTNT